MTGQDFSLYVHQTESEKNLVMVGCICVNRIQIRPKYADVDLKCLVECSVATLARPYNCVNSIYKT